MKSRVFFTLIALAATGLFTAPRASACINDRDSDTLAQQGKELPEVLRVITGRFPRNPPLYYQMRINRIERELKARPEKLALYDDIAVANDRLGKSDAAIAWMNRKYARLKKLPAKETASTREARYRYYANNGTFWAHRWLRGGADRAKIAQMKTARNLIARAIKIKPDAHFGREKYQLMTMNWIINPRVKNYEGKTETLSLAEYISEKTSDSSKGVTGLSGLVVLGNAWESLDVFDALRFALNARYAVTLEYLAVLRCRELIAQGNRSLLPGSGSGAKLEKSLKIDEASINPAQYPDEGILVNMQNQATLREAYKKLRAEAEAWQNTRTEYMMARLQNGAHPDTDKTFWRDWREPAPPSLELPWHRDGDVIYQAITRYALVLKLIALGIPFLILSFILWRVRRRRFA